MKKLLILLLLFCPLAHAQENIESFGEQNIATLNEELRKNRTSSVRASKQATDNASAITNLEAEFDVTTGHDHDGTDSKKVLATNLDMTGITSGHFLYNNAGTLAGQALDTSLTSYVGQFSENTSNASGDVSKTWTGSQPSFCMFFLADTDDIETADSTYPYLVVGIAQGSNDFSSGIVYNGSGTAGGTGANKIWYWRTNAVNGCEQSAVLKSFDSSGFTYTRTKISGSVGSAFTVTYACFK